MKSGYFAITTSTERRTTKAFTSEIAQFQNSFVFRTSPNENPWVFDLHNKFRLRSSDKIVAFFELDITKLYLIVNKAFSYGLLLNGIAGAKILIELRFLANEFIKKPEGTVRLEFQEVNNFCTFKIQISNCFFKSFLI